MGSWGLDMPAPCTWIPWSVGGASEQSQDSPWVGSLLTQVHVCGLRPVGAGHILEDGIQNLLLDLSNGITVEDLHWDLRAVGIVWVDTAQDLGRRSRGTSGRATGRAESQVHPGPPTAHTNTLSGHAPTPTLSHAHGTMSAAHPDPCPLLNPPLPHVWVLPPSHSLSHTHTLTRIWLLAQKVSYASIFVTVLG